MARLHDSGGNLLGGLGSAGGLRTPFFPGANTPQTHLNPLFGAEETVPGLRCSYGSLAYASARDFGAGARDRAHLAGCHNPVEAPDERHHCDCCGGDYCVAHAEAAAHDCADVILPA